MGQVTPTGYHGKTGDMILAFLASIKKLPLGTTQSKVCVSIPDSREGRDAGLQRNNGFHDYTGSHAGLGNALIWIHQSECWSTYIQHHWLTGTLWIATFQRQIPDTSRMKELSKTIAELSSEQYRRLVYAP